MPRSTFSLNDLKQAFLPRVLKRILPANGQMARRTEARKDGSAEATPPICDVAESAKGNRCPTTEPSTRYAS
jgi:hypothetical protein